MSRHLIILAVFALVTTNVMANPKLDAEAEKARKKTATKTIKCSPKGGGGTVSFEEAMKELKSGMAVQFAPGYYNIGEVAIFNQSNVIFEGDGSGGFVDIFLICYGQDVVVRNLNLHTLELGDGTVVDTKSYSVTITNGGKAIKTYLYNVGCIWLHAYINKSDLYLQHCTISNVCQINEDGGNVVQNLAYTTHGYGGYTVFNWGGVDSGGASVQIYKSIINSNYFMFGRPPVEGDAKKKKQLVDLTMEDCLIYGAKSLVAHGKDDPAVKDQKGLEDLFKVKSYKNILNTQPKFVKTPDTKHWWNISGEHYALAKDSPGQKEGMGIILGEKDMPSATPKK